MKQSSPVKSLDPFLNPYVFILKEGQEIQKNFLDYSLLLLKVGQVDVLAAPYARQKIYPFIQMRKEKRK